MWRKLSTHLQIEMLTSEHFVLRNWLSWFQ